MVAVLLKETLMEIQLPMISIGAETTQGYLVDETGCIDDSCLEQDCDGDGLAVFTKLIFQG